MSEQPTREMIEEALHWCVHDASTLANVARQYLASLDASVPSAEPEFATRSEGSPKDGTREPREGMKYRDQYRIGVSPPVPQEGVSDGALAQALLDYPAYGHWIGAESHNEHLAAALAPLLEKLRAARNLANSIEEENARLKARIEHWEKTADRHWSARHAAEARVKELEALLTIEVKSKQKTPSPSP